MSWGKGKGGAIALAAVVTSEALRNKTADSDRLSPPREESDEEDDFEERATSDQVPRTQEPMVPAYGLENPELALDPSPIMFSVGFGSQPHNVFRTLAPVARVLPQASCHRRLLTSVPRPTRRGERGPLK